ncbi:MAG: NUDIX domain-containing protein [Nitrolancea sp.]
MERLWTPWRMRYVGGDTRESSCIFCTKPATNNDVSELILYRGDHAFVIMNLYPYNTGHVMLVPFKHSADVSQLSEVELAGLTGLLPWVTTAQKRALRCDGHNVGLNLGSVAGAGVAEHLHVHVVPRWEGDANFMPILANTMVLPELIPVTYAKLRAELEVSALCRRTGVQQVPQAGAVVYVQSERKVALRRAKDGSIVLPKGHVESGEAAWQTAVREVDEEMGLRAEIRDWAGCTELTYGEKSRRIAYLAAVAEAGPEFADHLDNDTVLIDPAAAAGVLTYATDREILRAALSRLELESNSS